MPTTLREQLLVGIHQTERQLPRVPEPKRAELAAQLDQYLDQVRAADTDEVVGELFPRLSELNWRIVEAGR
jgi:hypothetical protein